VIAWGRNRIALVTWELLGLVGLGIAFGLVLILIGLRAPGIGPLIFSLGAATVWGLLLHEAAIRASRDEPALAVPRAISRYLILVGAAIIVLPAIISIFASGPLVPGRNLSVILLALSIWLAWGLLAGGRLWERGYWAAIGIGLIAIVDLTGLAARAPAPSVIGLSLSSAGALAAFAGGAVAIERILEAVWTAIDMLGGRTWPLGPEAARLNNAINRVNAELAGPLTRLEAATINLRDQAPGDSERKALASEILVGIATIKSRLSLMRAGSDNQMLAKAAGDVVEALNKVATHYSLIAASEELSGLFAEPISILSSIQELLAGFASNPARRLLSIVGGAILGLLAAYLLRLNVYTAVAPSDVAAVAPSVIVTSGPSIWIAVTGLVMGLGATPTHELIKAIQEYKQNQKAMPQY
jgi:hypothetical protein